MTTKLSSLRVSAQMDASGYVKGAAEKETADKRIIASSQSVGQALAAQDAVAGASARQFQSLSRAYIDGYAPAAKFEAAIKSLSNAMDRGLGAERASLILSGLEQKFSRTADATRLAERGMHGLAGVASNLNRGMDSAGGAQERFAKSTGLARHELINLGRQAQDVAVSLAGGQGLATVMMQQGSQIADVFTSSGGSFRGFVGQVGRGAATAITSVAGVTASVAALGAGVTYVGLQFADGQRDVERNLAGIGAASGATVASINAVAEATSRQQRISTVAAREIATVYAGTGRISSGNIAGLTGLTRDYAAQTGATDAKAAADELAKAFSGDVVQGAEKLNEKLGFLDNRTREYVRTLRDSADRQAAIKVTLDAMQPSIQGAADRVSVLTAAWERLKNVASNAVGAAGAALTPSTTQQQLDALLKRRAAIEGSSLSFNKTDRLADLQREEDRLRGILRIESEAAGFRRKQVEDNRDSLEAGPLLRATNADFERLKELRAEYEKLARIAADGGKRGAVGDDASLTRGLETRKNALDSFLTTEQRIRAEADLGVRATLARTLEEQKALASARESLSIAGQRMTTLERELSLQKSIAEVQAQAIRESRDAYRSANDNAALAGRLPYEAATIRIRQEMRELRQRTEQAPYTFGAGGYVGQGPFLPPQSTAPGLRGLDGSFAERLQRFIDAVGGVSIRSGFRTREEQEELYRTRPGFAARPGTSPHERGLAADLQFASPEARARAHAMAGDYGLAFPLANRARNPEPWHVEPAEGRRSAGMSQATADVTTNTRALNDNTEAAKLNARDREMIEAPLKRAAMEIENQNQLLTLQEQTYGKSAYAIARAAKEQELLNGFFQQGVGQTADLRARVAELADAYGRVAERGATLRLRQDLGFERNQIFRSDADRGFMSRTRGMGPGLDSAEASANRLNAALEQIATNGSGALGELGSAAMRGKLGVDTLLNVSMRLGDQLIQMASNMLIRQLLGSMFGGGGSGFVGTGVAPANSMGFSLMAANGAALDGGNVIPFARGGIVSRPTLFPMSRGTGLMGEAGPEAIMPLKRGPGGALGVQMHGGAPVTVRQGDVIVNNMGSSQVAAHHDNQGNTIIEVMDAIEARSAGRAMRGRGGFSGFASAEVAANARVG